jgi:hypothetical protein
MVKPLLIPALYLKAVREHYAGRVVMARPDVSSIGGEVAQW